MATEPIVEAAAETTSVFQSNLPLKDKLDRARTELLDLSAKNRLLNMPRTSKGARAVEIVDEKSSEKRLLEPAGVGWDQRGSVVAEVDLDRINGLLQRLPEILDLVPEKRVARLLKGRVLSEEAFEEALYLVDLVGRKRASDLVKAGHMLELEQVDNTPLRTAVDINGIDAAIVTTVGYPPGPIYSWHHLLRP